MKRTAVGLRRIDPELIARAEDETSETIVRIMLTFAGAASFCLLSLLAPDSSLLSEGQVLEVPFAGPVSFLGFIIVGPVVLITLRVYLQIYVEHHRRLQRISRWLQPARAPTLLVMRNPVLRLLTGFVLFLLLPLVMLAFAWKAAVLPSWLPGLAAVTIATILAHLLLPLRWPWRRSMLASLLLGAAFGATLVWAHPIRRPFNLFRADLSQQWLVDRDLSRAMLSYANLEGASLQRTNLEGAALEGANLKEANLQGASLQHGLLHGANLRGANLHGADLEGAIFSHVDLVRSLESAALELRDLGTAAAASSPPGPPALPLVITAGADLEGADLRYARLQGAQLQLANLQRADLSYAAMQGAELRAASLQHVNLGHAKLQRAQFQNANLEDAYLLGADLGGAYLEGAHLQGADLRGANLRGADLRGADLAGAQVSQDQIAQALGDHETVLPDGLATPATWVHILLPHAPH